MWIRLWSEHGAHPIEEDALAAEEMILFPVGIIEATEQELEIADDFEYVHTFVGWAGNTGYDARIVWPGLVYKNDSLNVTYRGRRAALHDERLDFFLQDQGADIRLFVGFENGPEPVLLWVWEETL